MPTLDTADMANGGTRTLEAKAILANMVVGILKAIEAYGDGAQARIDQRIEPLARKSHTVGYHTPLVASACYLASRKLKVGAHQDLATREDDKHTAGVGIGCYLLVKNTQKIGEGISLCSTSTRQSLPQ